MATKDVLTDNKTRSLARLLGIEIWAALGALEALWHVTGQHQPDGGIGRLSNQDIADEMFYQGNADQLIGAFIESGWLDKSDESHRLYVNDWSRQSDNNARRYLARRRRLFLDGSRPRPNQHLRLDSDTRCGRRRKRIRAAGGEASPAMRRRIFDRDGNACKECGSSVDLTVDHKKPVALGGLTIKENLQILCRPCNGRKKDTWLFVQ